MAMFKKGNKTSENTTSNISKAVASPANALNSLVKGTTITGEIESDNDIRIDGIIKGQLTCKAKVIIGPAGFIQGEIRCKNAIIEGKFEGQIHVTELLNIKETAEVNGDIFTNKLIVQSGAVFNVGCKMNENGKSVNPAKVAASNNGAKDAKRAS